MTGETRPVERERSGYENPRCIVCNGRLRVSDPTADRRILTEDGGTAVERGHRACLQEGVKRWIREGAAEGGPLAASRREGWRWAEDPPTRIDG
jgi:hypothetical protein